MRQRLRQQALKRCFGVALNVIALYVPAASLADTVPLPPSALQEQIEQIDQEIVLLRAELAEGNGERAEVERYLRQLRAMTLPAAFTERVQRLERFLAQSERIELQPSNAETVFKLPDTSSTVVVLLPLSGDFAVAGERVLAGLRAQWPFSKPFEVLDSALYDNLFELWELVKLYAPDFIIGPLTRDQAQAWQALKTGIPTLYLNQLDVYEAYEKALSPSKSDGLRQLHSFVNSYALQHILLLSENSQAAKNLQQKIQQAGSSLGSGADVWLETEVVEQSLDQSVRRVLNVRSSEGRKNWLQATLQTELEFEPRARQDIDAVISFLPLEAAMQVQPMLAFYHLNEALNLWYPPGFPSASDLLASLPFWQQTYAFLPPNSVHNTPSAPADHNQDDKTGLLYALGELAAKLVNQPEALKPAQWLGESPIGDLITTADGQLALLPKVYWLDDKSVQPITGYRFQFE
ncbi:penicillin-binding protein activator [Thiomicrorhabdus cannonii]|uniref:penicillin-binding protein activator n=1 Tax=Thiomicrorhabdus cannonii TaxID=2748011 RepID=UPI0015BBF02A|nr:hypothetical protein [Thiomicrorhabdus cannonii]